MFAEQEQPEEFVPLPYMIVESPEQIKAFTDPLRLRVLGFLREVAATNQQVADALGEPHAKVLYHVRFLIKVGLIQQVDTQIKGGNVEKYYRAVARLFELRPAPGDTQQDVALVKPALDRLRAEMLASVMLYPMWEAFFHFRVSYLTPAQMKDFNDRLCALVGEYFDPVKQPTELDAERVRLGIFSYLDPGDITH